MASVNVINNTTVNYVPIDGADMENSTPVEDTSSQPLTVTEDTTTSTPSVPSLDDVDPKILERMAELTGMDYEALIDLLTNENAEANIKALIETLTKKLDAAKANKQKRLEQAKKFMDFMEKNAKILDKLNRALTRGGFFGQLMAAECLMKLTRELGGGRLSFWTAMHMARDLMRAVRDPRRAADTIGKIAEFMEAKFSRYMPDDMAAQLATLMTGTLSMAVCQAAVNRASVSPWLHRICPHLADRIESRRMDRIEAGFANHDRFENSPYETMARNLLVGSLASGSITDFFHSTPIRFKDDAEIEELAKMLAKLVSGQDESLADLEQLIADLEESISTLVGLLGQITETKETLETNTELQDSGTMA